MQFSTISSPIHEDAGGRGGGGFRLQPISKKKEWQKLSTKDGNALGSEIYNAAMFFVLFFPILFYSRYILGWFFVYAVGGKLLNFFTRLVDVFHDTVDQERKVGKFSVRFRQKIWEKEL